MTRNGWRYVIALGLAALGGLISVSSDPTFPGWWDLCRHMILETGPTVVALRMTLDKP